MDTQNKIKELRIQTGLNRKEFSEYIGIPLRTVEDWEAGRRTPPAYIPRLISYQLKYEELMKKMEEDKVHLGGGMSLSNNITIITEPTGKKIVLINDLRFKGKTIEEWNEIEIYLKEYIGKYYEISETAEKIYIGKDFPDEFAHGKDKTVLKGPNLKAKANAALAIGELIQIADNKSFSVDYENKHGDKAKFGWYRYDTRLALPVYNDVGEVQRYNIYKLRMLVRHNEDGKLYLYDFLRTKKETSSPLK